VTELVIDQVHRIVGHMGPSITDSYAWQNFWWPTLGSDVKAFCNSCAMCQAIKTSNQRPQGLLHSLPIPMMPWSSIGMDFVGPFPLADDVDYIWVVLCRLTSLVHLIPLRTTMTAVQLAPLFMSHIVRLHGLPETIISDLRLLSACPNFSPHPLRPITTPRHSFVPLGVCFHGLHHWPPCFPWL
jgi:hypothetical protein